MATKLDRQLLVHVAGIIGPQSAAQQALDEADAFLSLSEKDGRQRTVNFYKQGHHYVVEKIDLGPEMMGS